MYKGIFGGLLLCIFSIGLVAEAATVMRTDEVVSVANDQSVAANFYAAGNVVTISGEMGGDVLVAGDTVTINGTVTDDVFAAGRSVSVNGEIGDDVRVIANDVVIDGTISGSLTVVGRQVKILSTATISGDVIVFVNDFIQDGTIGGQILGTITNARLNGVTTGDVNITTYNLTLGERAALAGQLSYISQQEYTRHPNASVAGSIARNDPVRPTTDLMGAWRVIAISIFMLLFGTLTLYVVLKRRVTYLATAVLSQPFWRSALIGFAVLVTTPFVISLLLVSMIGSLVGILVLILFIGLLIVSGMLLPVVTGALLATAVRQTMETAFLMWLLLAAVFLIAVLPLPVVGPIVGLTLLLITIGTVVRQAYFWVHRDTIS